MIVPAGAYEYRFELVVAVLEKYLTSRRASEPDRMAPDAVSVEALAADGWELCAGDVTSPYSYEARGELWIHRALFRRPTPAEAPA